MTTSAAAQGYGTMFYPSGERYEGEWSSGQRSGWGRMCYGDGSTYEGQWLADRPGGQGMLCLRKYQRPCTEPTARGNGPFLRDGRWCCLHLQRSPVGQRLLPCLVPLLGLWAGGCSLGKGGPMILKATHVEACFCCDLHLNDGDG